MRNCGKVRIDGFFFRYNEIGINISTYNGNGNLGNNSDGITISNNFFYDNFMDILMNNTGTEAFITNFNITNNVFGTNYGGNEFDKFVIWDDLADIVDSRHGLWTETNEDAAGGSYLLLDFKFGLILSSPEGLNFTGNTISGKTLGLTVLNTAKGGNAVKHNYFHGNDIGAGMIDTGGSPANYAVEYHFNRFMNNKIGLGEIGTGKVNATYNWWNSADWVDVKAQILSPVSVSNESSMIEYFPWALNGACTYFANASLTGLTVNSSWKGIPKGTAVYYDNINYIMDVNGFSTIQGAVEAAAQNYLSGATDKDTTTTDINVVLEHTPKRSSFRAR